MVVCKSRQEIKNEFRVVPRSLFAPDGSLLLCSEKSNLMIILEALPMLLTNTKSKQESKIPGMHSADEMNSVPRQKIT